MYKGHTNAPSQPVPRPYLNIPDIIPLVNGRWGIPLLQVPVDLLATSAGGQSARAGRAGRGAGLTGSHDRDGDARKQRDICYAGPGRIGEPAGGGGLLWVGGGVLLFALAGGAGWWFKKTKG